MPGRPISGGRVRSFAVAAGQETRRRLRQFPLGPGLLGVAAVVMVGLFLYALLETEPPLAHIVGVPAAAGVTGWAALHCLLSDRGRLHTREAELEAPSQRPPAVPRPAPAPRAGDGLGLSAWWDELDYRAGMTTFSPAGPVHRPEAPGMRRGVAVPFTPRAGRSSRWPCAAAD